MLTNFASNVIIFHVRLFCTRGIAVPSRVASRAKEAVFVRFFGVLTLSEQGGYDGKETVFSPSRYNLCSKIYLRVNPWESPVQFRTNCRPSAQITKKLKKGGSLFADN